MSDVRKELARIQRELKAPKNQTNQFGGYKYRSCEDILEALKPLLGDCLLALSDDVVEVAGRVYVKATAQVGIGEANTVRVSAFAREPESKKGMDASQITGTASSYARKMALGGLFLIDDTRDTDTYDNSAQPAARTETRPAQQRAPQPASDSPGGDGRPITDKMRKRLFAIARGNGLITEKDGRLCYDWYNYVISKCGFRSDRDVTSEAYEDVSAAVEKGIEHWGKDAGQ
ncbi:MAG: ERF family protein [bacterium]|nr:ERF family protein [bacterium]